MASTLVGFIGGSIYSKSGFGPPIVSSAVSICQKTESHTRIRHQEQEQEGRTIALSVVEEIVPPDLLPKYTQQLPFNVTRSMLRQSRPVIGNTQRLHAYLEKLQSRKCTKIIFIGGSVTAGHNAGGVKAAYPEPFIEWLNTKFPCSEKNGTHGRHEYETMPAHGSLALFVKWPAVALIKELDLVVIEENVNDSFPSGLAHALEEKGSIGEDAHYQHAWYFEVAIRRLLMLRTPDPPAIVTFNADYIGRRWAFPPYSNPESDRKLLFRNNAEPLKNWVSSMYEIPVFSAVIWMLPLAGKKGRDWQFNRTANPYNTAAWHADACCHPPKKGHVLLSLILAYCLLEEQKVMQSDINFDIAPGQRDFTADISSPILREPLYLSPEEDNMYVLQDDLECGGFDFTDPQKQESWKDAVVANRGWDWFADNKDKDKYGFIADGVGGGQHIALSLTGEQYGKVELTYVVSYENFGIALAWLDDSRENSHQIFCNTTAKIGAKGMPQRFDGFWDKQVSVPKTELLAKGLKKGEEKTFHICLTPRDDKRAGP
eukprot:CAMPEP_0183718108 /NCGR_PEP_ID=MMETSP0737-20130205/11454_1 /TAXON_ID=385413 /ORGANISM="Thalassiosira miniscula, Strain CCMP1093" /LENGTH=541 /DNA_ID=CAMNT_0025947601 /DNA_START=302 /DNA_END=1923 /DNA_ORIENTATION=+